MKLNDRLMAVASLVSPEDSLIDVGCDHAFLDIYLAEHQMAKRIVASDNKEGPVEQAKKNIKKHHFEDKISVQLANGIELLDCDIDTIVISGMGGRNMIGIVKYLPEKMKQIKTIILSPNSDTEQVRKEFVRMGYYIDEELLVLDHKFIYPVIRFRKGKKRYRKEDYLLGPILRQNKNNLFYDWNQKEIEQKELLLKVLPSKYWQRKWQLKQELKIRKLYLKK